MKQLIDSFSEIRPMEPKLVNSFIAAFERVEVPPKQLIKSGGEAPKHLLFIEKGTVSVYRQGEQGQRIVTAFRKEKDIIFDDTHLLTQTISDEYIISNEPVVFYRLHCSSLKHIMATCREFNCYLLALTATNCRELRTRCDILAAQGTDRYVRFKDAYGDIRFRVPVKHLCSYLAISEPTFYEAARCFGR